MKCVSVCFALLLTGLVSVSGQVVKGVYAPSFSLYTRNGNTISLSDVNGKIILVNFWASWCPPCRNELPALETLQAKYSSNSNFVMLVIGVGENYNSIEKFNYWRNLNLPFYADEDKSAFEKYQGNAIPYTILIDKEGRVDYVTVGYDEDRFQRMADELAYLILK